MKPFLFVSVLVAGCAATDDDPMVTETVQAASAQKFFEKKVYPLLAQKCGACHMASATSPEGTTSIAFEFVAWDPKDAYDLVLQSGVAGDFSVNAPITGIHKPVHFFDYRPAELDTVLRWLELERRGM
ncbi:MAG TPA: hypothetical protein VIV11_32310 [Kofleriaceae bacterium]